MDKVLLIIVALCLFCIIILLLLLILNYRNKLCQNNKEIEKMSKHINKAENTVRMEHREKRKSFRLNVDIECKFRIQKVDNKKIDFINEKLGIGVIKDISFSGLRMESIVDLPIKKSLEVKMYFNIDGYELELYGLLIRKEDNIKQKDFVYGIKIIETSLNKKGQFNKIIRAKELEHRIISKNA